MKQLKVAVAQIEVIPGHPDQNFAKMVEEINAAKERGMEMIVFSEMVLPGYLLGDEWENQSFIDDVMSYNEQLKDASTGITVIWGSLFVENDKKAEDGRARKYNAAFIAKDGEWVSNGVFEGHTNKTLMPKYREFDDERHFYSMLKLANETGQKLEELLQPFTIEVDGEQIKVGIILCEDMWCDDYANNPTHILIDNGAEMIVNLSCSPWTWRKNDKRNRVVKSLLAEKPVPFVYCNNIGTQNNGKNIFLFDGNSTVYNPDGSLLAVAKDYTEQVMDVFVGSETNKVIEPIALSAERDSEELYNGLVYGISKAFEKFPTKKVVIGLSGGVDSAVSAALLSKALGAENVYGVNMPSKFNSETTKGAARELAENLGVNYTILPIQESVDHTVEQFRNTEFERLDGSGDKTAVDVSDFTIENIQARDRGSRLLAGIAACLGAVFSNNGNKTETAIGYATLYGDVNGAIAPIADLYKNEVYQLARYINQVEGKEIIPTSTIEIVASAELSAEQDVDAGKGDPIKYDYHDKLLRSMIEFRRDPEQLLKWYLEGKLESELQMPEGTVAKYFSTAEEFISDLEHKWRLYKINFFKRIQAPPIIAVSRRAFGFDLRESQNGFYYTQNYLRMKAEALK